MNQTTINDFDFTNDKLCVSEDYSIPNSERAAIDRVIEMYENGEFKSTDFVEWSEVKERMRRLF